MNGYTSSEHTFVICAYGESEYLSECIDSLLAQKAKSNIIISTSTPNEHIRGLAQSYNIELRVNGEPPGIASDWNFAYKQAATRLITLAHQDDIYLPDYLSTALEMVNRAYKPIIFFSHYAEIVKNPTGTQTYDVRFSNLRLGVKKLMLKPMKVFAKSRFVRRRVLSLGNVICCPSVMFVDLKDVAFTSDYKIVLDWHKWEELSKLRGSFVYCEKPLMYHRLHEGAETAKAVQDGTRSYEDYIMFRKFWCLPVAKILARFYTKSEIDNGA